MTHLDLCTGIGGFHLAAEWAGFQTVGFSEVDPFCSRLLAEKWPIIPNYGDLRRADFSELRGRIMVLSAGVPCQPASLAGKRRGAKDDRWLWSAVLDVVERVEPTWCIFENPVGILSLDEFGGVLLCLESLGYEVRMFSVPANAVGAKHRRERVFIVANATSGRLRCGSPQRKSSWQSEEQTGQSARSGEAMADADHPGLQRWISEELRECPGERIAGTSGSQWRQFPRLTEPPLCRRADGIPNRSHRLKALGNAVVPQQVYPFFEAIAQVENLI